MPRHQWGQRLRAISLAVPLMATPGCSYSGPPICYNGGETAYGTEIYEVPLSDGGPLTVCEPTCHKLGYFVTCGGMISIDHCSFVALSDGGAGLSCSGIFGCGEC